MFCHIHSLTFKETELPQASDLDQPLANAPASVLSALPAAEPQSPDFVPLEIDPGIHKQGDIISFIYVDDVMLAAITTA